MYEQLNEFLSVLNDENRLKIIDMLSCGELSNKQLLNYLEITQPTLSHHIKVLLDEKFIDRRVEKNTHYYSLNEEHLNNNTNKIIKLFNFKKSCRCFEDKNNCTCNEESSQSV